MSKLAAVLLVGQLAPLWLLPSIITGTLMEGSGEDGVMVITPVWLMSNSM